MDYVFDSKTNLDYYPADSKFFRGESFACEKLSPIPIISNFGKVLYTGGTFDVPHLGHFNFIRQCRELFPEHEILIALNLDEFIERFKGKKPLFSYEERKSFLETIPYVSRVVPNIGNEDSTKTINLYNPDVIAIGNDWLEKDYCKQMGFTPQWLREKKISLIYLPYTEGISSTEIKKRLSER